MLRSVQEKALALVRVQWISQSTASSVVESRVTYRLLLEGHTHKRLGTAALEGTPVPLSVTSRVTRTNTPKHIMATTIYLLNSQTITNIEPFYERTLFSLSPPPPPPPPISHQTMTW
jgi:hypothetical protein